MSGNIRIAIVTGGSGGIGSCIGRSLAENNCRVYELSRHGTFQNGITHITADVSDKESVRDAVNKVLEAEGRLDLVVCNAGFGISGAVEFTQPEEAEKLMQVNFFGMVNTVYAAVPFLRESRGRIICISSVAGVLPIPFQTYYSVSKAAINAFAGALYNELRPFGTDVCAVMPGDVHTGFTQNRVKLHDGDGVYSGRISRSVSVMEHDEKNGMAPEQIGKYICRIAMKKRVKPLYTIGAKYKLFAFLEKILPCRLVSWILYRLYAS